MTTTRRYTTLNYKHLILTDALLKRYTAHLRECERASATVEQYTRCLHALHTFAGDQPLSRDLLLRYKQALIDAGYAPASINATIAAIHSLLAFANRRDLMIKPLKVQRALFCDDRRELSRNDYTRLLDAASRYNLRLSLVLQTICATGIRVSELRFITAEAVRTGRAEIDNKGKRRIVFLPATLRRTLDAYLRKQKKTAGAVFTTRTGKPLDRSNIWRDMKALCETAGVDPAKVFPHNLRHLFARSYYEKHRDMTRLADILGHSNINTTRIYTVESGFVHALQIEQLDLVMT